MISRGDRVTNSGLNTDVSQLDVIPITDVESKENDPDTFVPPVKHIIVSRQLDMHFERYNKEYLYGPDAIDMKSISYPIDSRVMSKHKGFNYHPMYFQILGEHFKDIPILKLYVNPTTISFNMKKQVYEIETLGGIIEEHWHQEPIDISCDLVTGGFFITEQYGKKGICVSKRKESDAYKSFIYLLSLYKSNGLIYSSEFGKVLAQGFIWVHYNENSYNGYFSSFSFGESSDMLHMFRFNFTFKVLRSVWRI